MNRGIGVDTGRVLVYGPYPPLTDPEVSAVVATVRERTAAGDVVEVVSPDPSGAHHHAHVDGLRGALRLAARVARFRPDEVVAHLDPVLLRARRPGPREPLARRVLGYALSGATVVLPELGGRVDPPYVALALGRAGRVVAAHDDDAEALRVAGLAPVDVSPFSARKLPDIGDFVPRMESRAPWPQGATRVELQAEVARRAALHRAGGAGGDGGDGPSGVPSPAGPLDRIVAYGDPPVWSPNPLARIVKAVVWRLTRFEVAPLIDQINIVHRAAAAERRPPRS